MSEYQKQRVEIIRATLENYLPLPLCVLLGYADYWFGGNLDYCSDNYDYYVYYVDYITVVGDNKIIIDDGDRDSETILDYNTYETIKREKINGSCFRIFLDSHIITAYSKQIRVEGNLFSGRHQGPISCLAAFSNDRIISGSHDKTLKIWNIKTLQEETTLIGHTGRVSDVAILFDNRIVSCSNEIIIWEHGKELIKIISHGFVVSILVLPDGRLVSASKDGKIKVWNIETRECEIVLEDHKVRIDFIKLLPNNQIIGTYGDGKMRIWNIETGKCRIAAYDVGDLSCLTVLPDGRVAGGSMERVRIWS